MSGQSATLEEQFYNFAQMMGPCKKTTISLVRSNCWMIQAKILDDRHITMTDTWTIFYKFRKSEITLDEWMEFLADLCEFKKLRQNNIEEILTKCGPPQFSLKEQAASNAAESAEGTEVAADAAAARYCPAPAELR